MCERLLRQQNVIGIAACGGLSMYITLSVVIRHVFLALLMTSVLSGCTTMGKRYIGTPTESPEELGLTAGDQKIDVMIDSLIIPEGPGSWVETALWDEYVLTIRNLSEDRITVVKVQLIDPRGLFIESNVDPWHLEKLSNTLSKEYKSIGLSVVVGTAPALLLPAAAAGGSVGTVVAVSSVMPIFVVAGPIIYMAGRLNQQKDRENIQAEFERRQIGPMNQFSLAPAATLKGSVFFPLVPSPRALVIDYTAGSETSPQTSVIEIPLDKLEGLHMAVDQAKEEESTKPATSTDTSDSTSQGQAEGTELSTGEDAAKPNGP